MDKLLYWNWSFGIVIFLILQCSGSSIPTAADSIKTEFIDILDDSKIVGGTETVPHEFPWLVTVVAAGTIFKPGYFCGGAIIDPNWVITAGHCAVSSAYQYTVRAGVYSRRQNTGTEVSSGVSEVFQHPNYNSETVENDIGLLKLSRKLSFNSAIQKITLPPAGYKTDGLTCKVAGWGLTSEHGSQPDTPRKVDIPIIPNVNCQLRNGTVEIVYNEDIGNREVLPSTQICAGGNGKSSCYGDSGSALMCPADSTAPYVAGIVSAGRVCGGQGIYTRVSEYLPWIKQKIGS